MHPAALAATLIFEGQVITGLVISVITTFCVAVDMLPLPSLNYHVITCVPCVLYVKASAVVPVIVPEQLSVVVATVAVAEH